MNNNSDGMTVNEKLFVEGYLDQFEKAVNDKNIESIKFILQKIGFNNDVIEPILKTLHLEE